MDSLVGLVSVFPDLWFRHKNPPANLYESGARVRRSCLRRSRPRRHRVHRSATLSFPGESHPAAPEWPVVQLGTLARLLAAVQRR